MEIDYHFPRPRFLMSVSELAQQEQLRVLEARMLAERARIIHEATPRDSSGNPKHSLPRTGVYR